MTNFFVYGFNKYYEITKKAERYDKNTSFKFKPNKK